MKSILNKKWLWFLVAAVLALQVYLVRELLAALILFTAVFAFFATIVLFYYAVTKGTQRGFAWLEPRMKLAAVSVRRGVGVVEDLSRKTFRRPRSAPAR